MDCFGMSTRWGMVLSWLGGYDAGSCQKVRMEGFKGNEELDRLWRLQYDRGL